MSDNPYAASSTRLASGTAEQHEIVLASRFKRLVARIIDGLIQVVVYLLFIYFIPSLWGRFMGELGTVPQNANPSTFDLLQPLIFAYDFSFLSVLDFLLAMAILFVVQGYFLAQYGQTIGKMALNVKIVDHESHQKPTLTRLFVVREVGISVISLVPLLGFIEVFWIFGSARRCVHDYWSRTIVVKAN